MAYETNGDTQTPSRRTFLKVAGGGIILAAGGLGLFASTRTPTRALQPWKLALGLQGGADPRRVILAHAILAPNPHNIQPWIVDLSADDEIVLYCDLDRRLPETDPFDRQITIGLGCFVELVELTAKRIGMRADIELFPEGEGQPRLDDRPVALIKLARDASVQADPLFEQIPKRRSAKEPYDREKRVPEQVVGEIVAASNAATLAGSATDPQVAAILRDIAWQAMETELRTYRTAKESVDLFRIGKSEIEANPDGIDLGGAFFEIGKMLGFMNREEFLDTKSNTFGQQLAAVREPFETAEGFVFVKTDGNTRSDQIEAGRSYVRMNLKATELGVAMQPWSQALQEFSEVAPQFAQIREVLRVEENQTLQMFARIGYATNPPPSPRWAYETRIRNT